MELNTNAGPLDILMASPNGELCIIETKLWKNPEARRKVIAQILDYAKEISSWTYEDLQREINRNLKSKGNQLYEICKNQHEELVISEADFIDSVSRNLSKGRFLLLIVGDGIKEGAIGITEFLSNTAHMNFSFGMIELNVYEAENLGTLILPKTIVKTVEVQKISIDAPAGFKISFDKEQELIETEEISEEKQFLIDFWKELIDELEFDDPGQALPEHSHGNNIYVYPYKTKRAWISAYFARSKGRVGVYFRLNKTSEGFKILDGLEDYKAEIINELGPEVQDKWYEGGEMFIRLPLDDIYADKNRLKIKSFFKKWLNHFVNVYRPKLKRID